MGDFIQLEIDDGVAIATMNAPESRNTLGAAAQFDAIDELCARLAKDRTIRALVLTGAGKAFCAGGDIKHMLERSKIPGAQPVDERYFYQESFHRLPKALYELETPTIAAVNGPAMGAGLDLACMCDIRIASDKALFAESFVKLGIIPGDGGAYLLQRLVGPSKAAEMTFTGDAIDAAEALRCGLVSRVTAPDRLMPEALALARRIAANPSHALRMAKRLMREAQHAKLDTILQLSGAFQALAHHTDDHHRLIGAAVDRLGKNPPRESKS